MPVNLIYTCLCGYQTNSRPRIREHLKRKIPCTTDKDLTKINVDDLCTGRLNKNSKRTDKEFIPKKNSVEYERKRSIKRSELGAMSERTFAGFLLRNMRKNSKKRNHDPPTWTIDKVLELLQKNKVYKVNENIEIPLQLTNGYFNSASFDRLDNTKGYTEDNIQIVPWFLNVEDGKMSKVTNWDEIIKNRYIPWTKQDLKKIKDEIDKPISRSFFYQLARNAYHHKGVKFGFDSIQDLTKFIINLGIKQGWRCGYLGCKMYPEIGHRYKMSLERLNPENGYTEDNIILIISSLNGRPAGQRKCVSEDQRKKSIQAGALGLNIDKLRIWTKLDVEKFQEILEIDCKAAESLIKLNKL